MDFDFLVIGAGSGGVRAARVAAGLGARTAVAEFAALGGTCVNLGCIPKKYMVHAASLGGAVEEARAYGWEVQRGAFDWAHFCDRRDREIQRLNGIYESLLQENGVTLLRGHARLRDPHTVEIDGRLYRAQKILLAVGGHPIVPDFPGAEYALCSDQIFSLENLPRRLLVLGGGYIGLEFCSIFHGLGVEVVLAYRGELFLRGFDSGLREFLCEEMRERGVNLYFGAMPERLERTESGVLQMHFVDGRISEADTVLYALGRSVRTEGLGLENTAVRLDTAGRIEVDSIGATQEPGIYAVGDATGPPELTPTAIAEGEALARRLFETAENFASMEWIPTAVFCDPALASVGMTEEEARAVHGDVAVYQSIFRPMLHRFGPRNVRNMVKIIALPGECGRVLGAHMVGEEAPEIIQGLTVALQSGATIREFKNSLALHPTVAEEFVLL